MTEKINLTPKEQKAIYNALFAYKTLIGQLQHTTESEDSYQDVCSALVKLKKLGETSALDAHSKPPQFKYKVVNVGTLLVINKNIDSYAQKGWEAVSLSACMNNNNYTVLFRKEQPDD